MKEKSWGDRKPSTKDSDGNIEEEDVRNDVKKEILKEDLSVTPPMSDAQKDTSPSSQEIKF